MSEKSPESKLIEEIREEYKGSYANAIFALTNALARKDEEIDALKERVRELEKLATALLEWVGEPDKKYIYELKLKALQGKDKPCKCPCGAIATPTDTGWVCEVCRDSGEEGKDK